MKKPGHGRRSIITDELIADFCAKVRVTGSIETAIKITGIGRETYYGWSRRVRGGEGNTLERKFINAVEKAEGEIKMIREIALTKHFDRNWQALAWWLERKFSPEYGQRHPPPLVDDSDKEDDRIVERIEWVKVPRQIAAPASAPVEPSNPDSGPDSSPAPESAGSDPEASPESEPEAE